MWPPAAARQRQRVHAGTQRSHAGPKTDRQAHRDIQRHTQTDRQTSTQHSHDGPETDRQAHTDILRHTQTDIQVLSIVALDLRQTDRIGLDCAVFNVPSNTV